MRPGLNSKRPRNNRNNMRRGPGNHNRSQNFDSNGPDVKVRGSSSQVYEKYLTLARDATTAGDRVMAENYFQHAEHYYRLLNPNPGQTDGSGQGNGSDQDQGSDQGQGSDRSHASDQGHGSNQRNGQGENSPQPPDAPQPFVAASDDGGASDEAGAGDGEGGGRQGRTDGAQSKA